MTPGEVLLDPKPQGLSAEQALHIARRDAEAARKAAGEACSALQMAWRDAESQWGLLRRSYKHRGQEEGAPREVPRPDMPPPIGR